MTCPDCGAINSISASVGERFQLFKDEQGQWQSTFEDCYELIVSCDKCWAHISPDDAPEVWECDVLENLIGDRKPLTEGRR